MTPEDRFNVLQVLEMVELKLVSDSNSCEFEYYLKLKEKLKNKLKENDGE